MKKVMVIVLLSIFVSNCMQVENKDKKKQNESGNLDTGFESAERIKKIYSRFPTPEEMMALITVDQINYNPYIINSPKDIYRYFDSRTQAINLGVYTADLAYLTIYKKHTESVKYFEAIYELSDNLQISSAFERSMLKRIQENITNSDSLKVISEQAYISISRYLESNNNEKMFALISMGGFVEALYLSFNLTGKYSVENPVIQKIADQKYVLENIIRFSSPYAADKSVAITINQLEELRKAYNELSIKEAETNVTRDNTGKLALKGGNKLLISEEQYQNLKTITYKIRKEITQN